ncbi:zinc-dependent metalloprotease [Amycolatopsis suaedae]|uniref:Coenzyme F420 biosynthesis-associated protein n=1 Tax=Amycolatopsis suaedae TaxID=2510978 RepID=A0A4Q7J5Q3_9PSEU|nr:zinc-dependent metalloprotease [Amycolatopsis suaedae]RZQ61633.1 coenzyme F420 biosynthesis-associated protein [Amycolatopsis suaedae]
MNAELAENRKGLIDWSLAASTGAFLVRNGPSVPRQEAEETVTELRELTVDAERHVRELTGLGTGLPLLPGEVVDRPGWVRAAAEGLEALTGQALPRETGGPFQPLLATGAGVQTGLVLAVLGGRVLGQYDPFGGDGGRLLLVAPNVAAAQQAMNVPGTDFRMWVCLHECTHRLQFTAVGWLRDYFADEVGRLIGGMAEADGLSELLGRLPETIKQARRGTLGLAELIQSPAQRAVFDRLLALSTLLEGHADYVMDAVGPAVVPSVTTIRSRFTERRKAGGMIDRVLRSLLGIDAKLRQYAEGAAFTRAVVDQVGMDGFNAVWTSPNTLPTRNEIADPQAWLRRVHR